MSRITLITASLILGLCGIGMAQGNLFEDPTRYVVGGSLRSVFCADFNGDSCVDMATVSYSTDILTVFLNSGDGTFTLDSTYTTGDGPVSLYGADIDADGDIDLAVLNKLGHTLLLFPNNGDGTFAAPGTITGLGWANSVLLADLNGDLSFDLIVPHEQMADPFMDDSIAVMFNNGDGTFQSIMWLAARDNPLKCVAVDLNGDSSLDLAAVNYETHEVAVLLNNGSGSFAPRVAYESCCCPTDISAADLDGDGDIDLVVPNSDSYDRSVVAVLLNNGDGSFQQSVYWNSGGSPKATFTANLDADDDIDIIVVNWMVDSLSILLNNGDATFQAPIQYLTGNSPASLFTADFDLDGYGDLTVGNSGSGDLLVYRNKGEASAVEDTPSSGQPDGFSLSQNRPNPFNPNTSIEFHLGQGGWVNLTVFDILGQAVTTLADEFRPAGMNRVEWDGAGRNGEQVASGVYFYRLKTEGFTASRKMVLLR